MELDGDPLIGYLEDYAPVRDNGERVGHISSAFWSPRLKRNIGFALVPISYAQVGTELTAQLRGAEVAVRVVPKPFLDPRKEIPKGDPVTAARAA